ncbi:sortase-like protein [Bifidobacterium margollesii]|uniref:Sortase-like protein n=1 Tax=Bifidobacterium margollesii TaxID=2020964 RepID=A0A2N5JCH9_9BIFI|nr:class C sortase [Bifidobacterium margollesii]PLS31926.1 sortase-like protein [Bifidobacterium margollesii]
MKKLRDILPLLVIIGGLLVLFYPTISNLLIMRNASRAVGNYDAAVNAMSEEQYAKVLNAAHAYNAKLAKQAAGGTTALSNAVDSAARDKEYQSILNIDGNGMMGYITVPRLHETLPLYHGTAEKVLQVGIGHLEGTSFPVGGASTHTAVSGHRGLPSAKLFTDLDQMKKGDLFFFRILKDTYAYQVDNIITVLPTDTTSLAITAGKDQATLITCTPYGVNTHRLLVRAHRVPYTPDLEDQAAKQFGLHIPPQYLIPMIGLAVLLVGGGIARHLYRRTHDAPVRQGTTGERRPRHGKHA